MDEIEEEADKKDHDVSAHIHYYIYISLLRTVVLTYRLFEVR